MREVFFLGFSLAVHGALYTLARAHPPRPIDAPTATMPLGESWELPAERAEGTDGPESSSPPPERAKTPSPMPREAPRLAPRMGSGPGPAASSSGSGAPAGSSERYGSTERYAVDLAAHFSANIPRATSPYRGWQEAPEKSLGEATLVLRIDEGGHLLRSEVQITGSPDPALRTALEQTVGLVGGHAFFARSAVTRLRVSGVVSRVTGGEHGEFTLAKIAPSDFAGGVGHPYFVLASGKRVDFTVRLVP